jgi:Na+/phosphate symporter
MDGFNIVMVIAIILFARLGVRLVTGYIKMKKEDKDDTNDNTASKQE